MEVDMMASIGALSGLPSAVLDLAQELGHLPGVRRVFLFGSRARGGHHERSDVDLAVDADENLASKLAALELVEQAATLLPIDLVWFSDASPSLWGDVQREGIVLFERTNR
jgi:predicted nucleotidyltransferase